MEAIKVLVVDDNKRIVTILKEALERESDMEVVGTASDGEEALHKISTLRPDVVLLDLIMPKVDGLGVMERMKTGAPTMSPEFVVVSAVRQKWMDLQQAKVLRLILQRVFSGMQT